MMQCSWCGKKGNAIEIYEICNACYTNIIKGETDARRIKSKGRCEKIGCYYGRNEETGFFFFDYRFKVKEGMEFYYSKGILFLKLKEREKK